MAAGAGVTGALALARSHQAQDDLNSFPASKGDLEDLRHEQRTFSLVSDGLLIGALALAGVSLYLSLAGSPDGPSPPLPRAEVAQSGP